MKKKAIIWITMLLFFIWLVIDNGKYISQSIGWRLNWGFEAPKPSKIETIFNTRNGFPNEGETFFVLSYRSIENKLKERDGWISINRDSYSTVSNLLEGFQKSTADINDDTMIIKKLFQENPVTYYIGDSFFYKLEEDNSYILAIANAKEKKLFVMEWIQ